MNKPWHILLAGVLLCASLTLTACSRIEEDWVLEQTKTGVQQQLKGFSAWTDAKIKDIQIKDQGNGKWTGKAVVTQAGKEHSFPITVTVDDANSVTVSAEIPVVEE